MMAFVGAYQGTSSPRRAFSFSLLFVIGLTLTFTLLGFVAALMGRLVGDVGRFWPYLVAAVCLVMGLHLLGVWSFNLPLPQSLKPGRSAPGGHSCLGFSSALFLRPVPPPSWQFFSFILLLRGIWPTVACFFFFMRWAIAL